jgi:ABC-type oligopeptide transport system ATPase subunit
MANRFTNLVNYQQKKMFATRLHPDTIALFGEITNLDGNDNKTEAMENIIYEAARKRGIRFKKPDTLFYRKHSLREKAKETIVSIASE